MDDGVVMKGCVLQWRKRVQYVRLPLAVVLLLLSLLLLSRLLVTIASATTVSVAVHHPVLALLPVVLVPLTTT